MYDGSGEFALTVGFPAKSGVGGGILGVIPRKMGIGVFGPALDKHGNSVAGMRVMVLLSQALNLNIYWAASGREYNNKGKAPLPLVVQS